MNAEKKVKLVDYSTKTRVNCLRQVVIILLKADTSCIVGGIE